MVWFLGTNYVSCDSCQWLLRRNLARWPDIMMDESVSQSPDGETYCCYCLLSGATNYGRINPGFEVTTIQAARQQRSRTMLPPWKIPRHLLADKYAMQNGFQTLEELQEEGRHAPGLLLAVSAEPVPTDCLGNQANEAMTPTTATPALQAAVSNVKDRLRAVERMQCEITAQIGSLLEASQRLFALQTEIKEELEILLPLTWEAVQKP